jgi:hypothetical protein
MPDHKIEITIIPTLKLKAKSFILGLLYDYDIDDESDINGIDFILQEDSRLIGKCVIKFKKQSGELNFNVI